MSDTKEILEKVRPYLVLAGREAEREHDDQGGCNYMCSTQYDIMRETEQLIKEIDGLL